MLNAKSNQFNVNNEVARGNLSQGSKIRRRQDAWEIGEMATHHGTRRNLWSAFVRVWLVSRPTGGGSFGFCSSSGFKKKTAAGFSFYRERPLPRPAAPGN